MILEEGKWFDRHCPPNQAGVDLLVIKGILTAVEVDKEGPAWASGLRSGDKILSINGREASKYQLDEIGARLYWIPKAGIRLTVARETESNPLDIRLNRNRR